MPTRKNVYPVASIGADLDLTFSPIPEWDKTKVRDAIEAFLFNLGVLDPIVDLGYITQEVSTFLETHGELHPIAIDWEVAPIW
jgi:hypothetical protein